MLVITEILSNPIMLGFIVMMLILAVIDFKTLKSEQHRDFKSAIVSLGILGTFFGIFLGLLEFDTKDIAASVPLLLEGLKLAFVTSISGLALSTGLFVFQKLYAPVSDDDIGILQDISRKLDRLENLDNIAESSNETVEQFKHLRMDIGDEQKKLRRFIEVNFEKTNDSLEKAIETLSKGATQEIIKALEEVISDFNQNLKDQFGENFKQLNEAVLNLLGWQENYKSHVEDSEKLLQTISTTLNGSKETFDEIAERSKETQDIYEKLKDIIETYSNQSVLLNQHLESYSKLGVEAEKAFSTLDSGFKSINTDMDKLTEGISKGLTTQTDTIKQLTQDLSKQLPESLGELEKTLVGLTRQFGKDYESFLEKVRNLMAA